MIRQWLKQLTAERRAVTLAAIIVAQALCAMFFLADVLVDFRQDGPLDGIHLVAESTAAIALSVGVVYLMLELRSLLSRMDSMETGLRAARGEMADVVAGFFDTWGLSAAERDVALLLLKGFDNETIAGLRGTAKGTVRAQTAAIYGKAGVDGRAQLISLLLEELLADDGSVTAAAPPPPAAGRTGRPVQGSDRP